MDFDEIKQILDMMREHELAEFELERDDFKLRLRKHSARPLDAPARRRRRRPAYAPPLPRAGQARGAAPPAPRQRPAPPPTRRSTWRS